MTQKMTIQTIDITDHTVTRKIAVYYSRRRYSRVIIAIIRLCDFVCLSVRTLNQNP